MSGTKTIGGGRFWIHTIQFKLAVGYAVVIVAVLILLNTYPLIMTQDLVFQSKQTSLQSQAMVIANTLTGSDTLTAHGVAQSMGEISTECYTDIPAIARRTVERIGYTNPEYGFDYKGCAVLTSIDEQSPDIALGVDKSYESKEGEEDADSVIGAGDQGMPSARISDWG